MKKIKKEFESQPIFFIIFKSSSSILISYTTKHTLFNFFYC